MDESVHERIAAARRRLVEAGFSHADAALDADVLARHVLGWDVARLLLHRTEPAPPGFAPRFEALVARRAHREPVALILGQREFWGLRFLVTTATLIPRPETELIVEEALRWIDPRAPVRVLDVGTGSGCLAVSLAHERPAAHVVATDISQEALLVARRNAVAHGVDRRVTFVRTDLTAGLALEADVIVSNPPYVPEVVAAGLPRDVIGYEPRTALFGGPDGLRILHRLFTDAAPCLARSGALVAEFGAGQEDDVRALALGAGWRIERILPDLQGIARTIVLRR